MKEKIRFDQNRVRLRRGEYQRPDGSYEYRYRVFGKQFSIYSTTLEGLREKETERDPAKDRGLKANPYRIRLNDVFTAWKELKRGVRDNTFRNYCYLYDTYLRDTMGTLYVAAVRKSDIKDGEGTEYSRDFDLDEESSTEDVTRSGDNTLNILGYEASFDPDTMTVDAGDGIVFTFAKEGNTVLLHCVYEAEEPYYNATTTYSISIEGQKIS